MALQALKDAQLDLTPANERMMRKKLRQAGGPDVIVKRIATQIRDLIGAGQKRIIADGLYSWTEYKYLKREFPGEMNVIAIVAPRSLRHRRLTQRPFCSSIAAACSLLSLKNPFNSLFFMIYTILYLCRKVKQIAQNDCIERCITLPTVK